MVRVLRRRRRVFGGRPWAARRAFSSCRVFQAARMRWLRTISRVVVNSISGARPMGFPSQRGEILLEERSSPMGETRRKFDKDFREGAVRLVRETGKPIAQVARDLGINSGTLGNWVDADRRRRGEGDGAL